MHTAATASVAATGTGGDVGAVVCFIAAGTHVHSVHVCVNVCIGVRVNTDAWKAHVQQQSGSPP